MDDKYILSNTIGGCIYCEKESSCDHQGLTPCCHIEITELGRKYIEQFKEDCKPREVNEFIKNHHEVCYCEALITSDGMVSYVRPSHQESLIRIAEVDREELMNHKAGFLEYLIERTHVILIWYDHSMSCKNPTEKQLQSYHRMVDAGIITDSMIDDHMRGGEFID